jgi:RecB family exonuclease
LRVSYSKLDKLDNCALQFVLSEELGLEGQASYYAWVGHLVHRLIEDFEEGGIEHSEEGLVKAAEERWRLQEFPSFAVSEAFRRSVTTTMLPAWFREYANTPSLDSEVRFEFEFEGATVTGFIDRVGQIATGGTQITDYKTGKGRDATAEDNLQLGIYYLGVNQAEELERFRPVKAVELAFLKDVRNGQIKRVQLGLNSKAQREYGETMAKRLATLVGRLRDLEETDTYRPDARAECRYCDFKTLCPLWPEGQELFPAARAGVI